MRAQTHIVRQPLKWHGGKHYLASWIISHFPPHLHYVEPYFGGGAVLFARDPQRDWFRGHRHCKYDADGGVKACHRGCSEVINDIYRELTNFWSILQDAETFASLKRRLIVTAFSEVEWQMAFSTDGDEVARAANFLIRYRQSRQALGERFATLAKKRTRAGMDESASAWLSAIDGLAAAHERLRGVVIRCDDAINVIRQEDGPYTEWHCREFFRRLAQRRPAQRGCGLFFGVFLPKRGVGDCGETFPGVNLASARPSRESGAFTSPGRSHVFYTRRRL